MFQHIKDSAGKISRLSMMFGNRDIEYQAERLSESIDEAEELVNDTQAALNDAQRQCAELAGKVACLNERLDYWMQRARSHEDEDGCPLHEIHRAYGVESVDKGVSDHE